MTFAHFFNEGFKCFFFCTFTLCSCVFIFRLQVRLSLFLSVSFGPVIVVCAQEWSEISSPGTKASKCVFLYMYTLFVFVSFIFRLQVRCGVLLSVSFGRWLLSSHGSDKKWVIQVVLLWNVLFFCTCTPCSCVFLYFQTSSTAWWSYECCFGSLIAKSAQE